MIQRIEHLMDTLVRVDERLGLKKLIKYLIVLGMALLLIPVLSDPRGAIKGTVEFFLDLTAEIDRDRQVQRDEVIKNLVPLLRELRAETGADRAVYFEYHNSIENEAGVPFKYVDLVQQSPKMGLSPLPPLDNVNASRFAELYLDLIDHGYIVNPGDSNFYYRYPGAQEIAGKSVMQVYCNIPGIQLPLGMIVLEWYDREELDWDQITKYARKESLRVNALMHSVAQKQ
jgi:hypothetical protein